MTERGPWEDFQPQGGADAIPESANRNPPATYPGAAQMLADANADGPWNDFAPASEGGGGGAASSGTYRETPDGLEIDITGGRTESEAAADAARAANPANDSEFARMISGKPAPAARPSLFRADSDFYDRVDVGHSDNPLAFVAKAVGTQAIASAKDMFGGHESAAKYLAEKAGGHVEHDKDGDPIVVLPDGTRYLTNDKGFDPIDATNIAGNVAAAYLPASWAGRLGQARQLGLVGRLALQAGTAAATDAAEQAAVNEGNVDPTRVAAAGAGGAGGEVIGSGIVAGARAAAPLVRRITGAGAARARDVLRTNDIPITAQNVERLAGRLDQLDAGADPRALLGENEFGLIYTRGQRTLDPKRQFAELSREELLRQTPGGNNAFAEATRTNQERVGNALANIGERLGGKPGATPAELAEGAASRVRAQATSLDERITQAYEKAGEGARTSIDVNAVRDLPNRMRAAVADMGLNPKLTPAASETLDEMTRASDGLLRSVPGGRVAAVTLKALETQRRILNSRIGAAANDTDRRALTLMKREFDGWLDDSIDTALTSGDAGALQALKEARALRAEFGRRFEGKADTDKFIGGLLDGTRTPEELVNVALGASQVSKAGGARFVARLQDAAGNDPEVIGQLRAAHFLRMTQGRNGETSSFGQLVRNIRSTEYGNGSIVKALYSPQEWGEIRRLADALEPLVAKGDFARSSGTAERLARMMFQKTIGGVPVVGDIVKGFGEGVNAVKAARAVNAPLRLRAVAPAIAPALGQAETVDAGG